MRVCLEKSVRSTLRYVLLLYLDLESIVIKLSDFWFYERGRLEGLLLVPLDITIGHGNFTVNW